MAAKLNNDWSASTLAAYTSSTGLTGAQQSAVLKMNENGMMPGQIVEVLNSDPENVEVVAAKCVAERERNIDALKKQHPNPPVATPGDTPSKYSTKESIENAIYKQKIEPATGTSTPRARSSAHRPRSGTPGRRSPNCHSNGNTPARRAALPDARSAHAHCSTAALSTARPQRATRSAARSEAPACN